MLKSKFKIIITTFVLSLIFFSLSVYAEKKAANFSPTEKVLVCIPGQKAYKDISNASFALVDRSIATIPPGAVKSYAELKNKVTKDDILPNEVLSTSKLIDKNSGLYLSSPNMRKFSIPMTYIDDPIFAATLRQGDLIDIFHTELPTAKNPIPTTTLVVQKAMVVDAVDTNGRHLTKSDTQLASEIILEGEPEQTLKLTNEQFTGKFKYAQTQKNSENYTPIQP